MHEDRPMTQAVHLKSHPGIAGYDHDAFSSGRKPTRPPGNFSKRATLDISALKFFRKKLQGPTIGEVAVGEGTVAEPPVPRVGHVPETSASPSVTHVASDTGGITGEDTARTAHEDGSQGPEEAFKRRTMSESRDDPAEQSRAYRCASASPGQGRCKSERILSRAESWTSSARTSWRSGDASNVSLCPSAFDPTRTISCGSDVTTASSMCGTPPMSPLTWCSKSPQMPLSPTLDRSPMPPGGPQLQPEGLRLPGGQNREPSAGDTTTPRDFDPETDSRASPEVIAAVQIALETRDLQPLMTAVRSANVSVCRAAVAAIRSLTRSERSGVSREAVGGVGGADILLPLLESPDLATAEHAVSALMNLCLCDQVKKTVVGADSVVPLVRLLTRGTAGAKETAAAALFLITRDPDQRERVALAGATSPLLDLLLTGRLRGRKDAALAMFYLALDKVGRENLIQSGAVPALVRLLADPDSGVEDKLVAVLCNMSRAPEGRRAVIEGKGIPALVACMETGSERGKGDAVHTLLVLADNSEEVVEMLEAEGATPGLMMMSGSGMERAQKEAKELLEKVRNFRSRSRVTLPPKHPNS